MMLERIERGFGRGQHFNIESFVQGAGPKFRRGERRIDGVEIVIRGVAVEPHLKSENFGEHMIKPKA